MAEKTDRLPAHIEAYVDTGAFIAFFDKSDTWHPRFAGLFASAKGLVTTQLVVAEAHGWFLRRFDSFRGLEFISFIEALNILTVLPADVEIMKSGAVILRKYSDHKLTLADACGLYLLKKFPKLKNWSTDRHLALTGRRLIID